MNKTSKFVDPMEALFTPPPHKTKLQAVGAFFYDSDEGSCLGRTPKQWLRVFVFYCVFYAGLAVFWAICMWGLLQTIDDDIPTYVLDRSIIGTSPGLASRPMSPEGRESILLYNRKSKKWSSPTISDLPSVDTLLKEYQTSANNTESCSYDNRRQNESAVCDVDYNNWGNCKPNGTDILHMCMYFKINKVFEWLPEYYTGSKSLPQEMPEDLKNTISETLSISPNNARKVWLSCEGRHEEDKENLGKIAYFPEQEAKQKLQAEWTTSNKAAATKQYFPSVQDRLRTKLTLTTKLAAVLTGHVKTRAYLYRFKLRDDARCICGHEDQTKDHLLFRCEKTSEQREVLKQQTNQQRNWMKCKQELISKHTKVFCDFVQSIDFELLQQNE